MPRVLVFGTGLVGTFAARALAEEGAAVVTADLNPVPDYFRTYGPRGHAGPAQADMLNPAEIRPLLEAQSVDVVVVAAGLLGEACRREPETAWEVNVEGPRVVAEAALRAGVRRLV